MALRRSLPFAVVVACAAVGVGLRLQALDPGAADPRLAGPASPIRDARANEAPLRPVIGPDGTIPATAVLDRRRGVFELRSLRTLRAGVFQMPIYEPADFAVGPLAVVPVSVSLDEPDLAPESADLGERLDPDGGFARGGLKRSLEGWPTTNRQGKGDLDREALRKARDPAFGDIEIHEVPPVTPPFEREPVPVSPLDGATPAALSPAEAGLDRRTTDSGLDLPIEVAAAPVLVFAPNGFAMLDPPLGADEGLTTLARAVGLDDGTPRPMDLPPVAYTRAHQCLAEAIYHEARGESVEGQVAVAQVVMNRVRSPHYPKDVCSVVYQNQARRNACQFSFACDGVLDRENEPVAWAQAQEIAHKVMGAEVWVAEVSNATHYHATYVSPRWIRDMVEKDRIGRHIFYRVRWWS
jgi:hypothetical protein